MDDHGYNPSEMPPHESGFCGPLEEPGPVRAARVVDFRPPVQRARAGEPVWVCVSCIKPDKRDAFARHIREVQAPAVRAVKPEAHASVRLLEPLEPNPDGTWSFVWLMDPALPGEDYAIAPVYEAHYGALEATEHMREWDDCHVGEQLFFSVTQAEW